MSHTQVPLAEVQAGDMLAHIVRIHSVLRKVSKQNKGYLEIKISDKSGHFMAKKFGENWADIPQEECNKYANIPIAIITGNVEDFKGSNSLKITSIAAIDEMDEKVLSEILGPERTENEDAGSYDGLFQETTKEKIDFTNRIKAQKPVRDLVKSETADHILQVKNFNLRKSRDKESYYFDIAANDQTKEIIVKRFRANKNTKIPENIYAIYVKGKVDDYKDRGTLSILADEIELIVDATEADTTPLWPASTFPIGDLKWGLWRLSQAIENQDLKKLCVTFLQDPMYKENFALVPAATGNHHNHKAGLCEHLYTATSMAKEAAILYNNLTLKGNKLKLNIDSVVAGMLFHDALKVDEYYPIGNYRPEGNILRHIERGIAYVAKNSAKLGCSAETTETLCHIISAHHGKLEWGSFSEMACPEAALVHHLDDWCSKLDPTIREFNQLKEGEKFTKDQVKALKSVAYRGSITLDKPAYDSPREVAIPVDYTDKYIYKELVECLNRIKNPKLQSLCKNLLTKHKKEFLIARGFEHYSVGLAEFAVRLMLFMEGMVYIWNKWTWPQNKVFLDTDVIVASGFLISLFKIRKDHPILDDIAYAFAEIAIEADKIEGFDPALADLLMHVIRSQVSRDDVKFCAPESIFVHYIYRLLLLLDQMMLELSNSSERLVKSSQLGRVIFRGLCEPS